MTTTVPDLNDQGLHLITGDLLLAAYLARLGYWAWVVLPACDVLGKDVVCLMATVADEQSLLDDIRTYYERLLCVHLVVAPKTELPRYASCEQRLGVVAFVEPARREDRAILICDPGVSVDAADIVLDHIIGPGGWRRRPRTIAEDAGARMN